MASSGIDPITNEATLQGLLVPAPDGVIETYAVGRHVNKPENDDPKCVERA